jgi:RNA-directed DNA polymerase
MANFRYAGAVNLVVAPLYRRLLGTGRCTRFESEADARRFWDAMRQRLREFSLTLHPDKTRLIEFGPHAAQNREKRGLGKPETFKFLGFVLICGKSRRGDFQIRRTSRRDRMRARLQETKEGLRQRWHLLDAGHREMARANHRRVFRLPCRADESAAIGAFRYHVTVLWHRRLCRRSQTARLVWPRMAKLADDFLPSRGSFTPGPVCALPSDTRGRRRVPELGLLGSGSEMSVPTANT